MKRKFLTVIAAIVLGGGTAMAADCCGPNAECCKQKRDCCADAAKPENGRHDAH